MKNLIIIVSFLFCVSASGQKPDTLVDPHKMSDYFYGRIDSVSTIRPDTISFINGYFNYNGKDLFHQPGFYLSDTIFLPEAVVKPQPYKDAKLNQCQSAEVILHDVYYLPHKNIGLDKKKKRLSHRFDGAKWATVNFINI